MRRLVPIAVIVATGVVALVVTLVTGAGGASADQPPGGEVQGFGNTYVLLDSTDVGGPAFNTPAYDPAFVAFTLNGQDDATQLVRLDFTFTFYGTDYTRIYLSSNGLISFGSSSADDDGHHAPLATNPFGDVPAAFGYWTDLDPVDQCESEVPMPVTYGTFGAPGTQVFVAEWNTCSNIFGTNSAADYLRFQIRLFEGKNWIEFHYFDVVESQGGNSNGLSTTVGLRNGAPGSAYLQYGHDEAVIDNTMAIRMWHPRCNGVPADVVGTRGADVISAPPVSGGSVFAHGGGDTIVGSDFDDNLCGGDGADTIDGGIGNDWISGGNNRDELAGGNGHDTIYGNAGGDTITGGQGDDHLYGAGGNDRLIGGPGADHLFGQGQNDVITGEGGNDSVFGGTGFDTVTGGGGDDLVNGGAGNDTMNGGAGVDTMIGGAGDDTMNGGAGADTMAGGGGNDLMEGFDDDDVIAGGGGADSLSGLGGDDLLTGGPGVDVIQGGAGDDNLFGNGANDTLDGGSGSNQLDGGGGIDTCTSGTTIRCE